MRNGQPIDSDFFQAKYIAANGLTYENLHSGIVYREELHRRHLERHPPDNMAALNILMFGFDSVSRMTWLRNLPKSHEYFVKTLGAVVLEGYNIVGDGTPQALLPILTGQTEAELPEARRGHKGATVVDGHPWIWREYEKAGYVTQWGEMARESARFSTACWGSETRPWTTLCDRYTWPSTSSLVNTSGTACAPCCATSTCQ